LAKNSIELQERAETSFEKKENQAREGAKTKAEYENGRSTKLDSRALKLAAAVALSLLASPASVPTASAQVASPFASLAGSWSGTGVVETSNGNERIRCRAAYEVAGMSLQLNLRCASDSFNFNLASSWRYDAGEVSGKWSEASRNVSGTISGRVSGNQILVTAQGLSFAANLLLVTRGNNQSVSIRGSGSEIKAVDIALRR
jgi:hypothetical protein